MSFPKKIKILGMTYTVNVCVKASDVDIDKRVVYWGQVDYWTNSIRIFKRDLPSMFQTLFHEIIHIIETKTEVMKITETEQRVDLMATMLFAALYDNKLMEVK